MMELGVLPISRLGPSQRLGCLVRTTLQSDLGSIELFHLTVRNVFKSKESFRWIESSSPGEGQQDWDVSEMPRGEASVTVIRKL
jgi:hypothetical protein